MLNHENILCRVIEEKSIYSWPTKARPLRSTCWCVWANKFHNLIQIEINCADDCKSKPVFEPCKIKEDIMYRLSSCFYSQ